MHGYGIYKVYKNTVFTVTLINISVQANTVPTAKVSALAQKSYITQQQFHKMYLVAQ